MGAMGRRERLDLVECPGFFDAAKPVGASLLAKAFFQAVSFFGLGTYPLLRVLLMAVSPLRRVPFSNAKKEPKGFAPTYGPRKLGSLRSGIDPGAAATVCFAAPPSAVYDFVVRSLRSHARINPYAQPSDVAG